MLVGQKGGCIIVDSTRKGKRFPDSMSKTIPIWACVLNRAIENHWQRMSGAMQQGIELVGHKFTSASFLSNDIYVESQFNMVYPHSISFLL